MKRIIDFLYRQHFWNQICHTLIYSLQEALKNCKSVLDIGCGPDSPLQHCKNIKYSVGVEPFKLYLVDAKKRKTHTKYINKKAQELDFPEKSFDAVIMTEVLEHFPKKISLQMLSKAEKWAKKKVVITVPNGFLVQAGVDDNPLQEHLSGWTADEFRKRGYRVTGRAGLRCLRKDEQTESRLHGGDIYRTMRWQPGAFWYAVSGFSQLFVYFFPELAYGLFCVKEIKRENYSK